MRTIWGRRGVSGEMHKLKPFLLLSTWGGCSGSLLVDSHAPCHSPMEGQQTMPSFLFQNNGHIFQGYLASYACAHETLLRKIKPKNSSSLLSINFEPTDSMHTSLHTHTHTPYSAHVFQVWAEIFI